LKTFSLYLLVICAISGGLLLQPAPVAAQEHGWDTIPHEFREFQRQGFRDGLQSAQRDFENHRRPDVNNRDEFRNPKVPPAMVNDYRDGFRRGYDAGVRHFFTGGASGAMPSERPIEQRDDSPHDRMQYGRIGYNDGMIGAQKDFDNHRRPDADHRDEFRAPNVPAMNADEYRAGFRRGYEDAVRRIYPNGVPAIMPWEQRSSSRWDDVPSEFSDARRNGFREGLAAAQRDYDSQRRPDPERHEQFRHPAVPGQFADEFREGFRRGYEASTRHLYPNGVPAFFPGETPPPPPSPWLTMDHNTVQTQRTAFVEGVLAAGQDYEAGSASDLNRHEEYRSPKMNFLLKVVYKTGFKIGYDTAMRNLTDRVSGVASPLQRSSFMDGVAAAHSDFTEKRRPELNLHQEFNQPQVRPAAQEEYRESFRLGFEMANGYLY